MKGSPKLILLIILPVMLLLVFIGGFWSLQNQQFRLSENLYNSGQLHNSLTELLLGHADLQQNLFEYLAYPNLTDKQQHLLEDNDKTAKKLDVLLKEFATKKYVSNVDVSDFSESMQAYLSELARLTHRLTTQQGSIHDLENVLKLSQTVTQEEQRLQAMLKPFQREEVLKQQHTIKTQQHFLLFAASMLVVLYLFFLVRHFNAVRQLIGTSPESLNKLLEEIKHFDFSIAPAGHKDSIRWRLGELTEGLSSFMAAIYDTGNEQMRRTGSLRRNFDETVSGIQEIQINTQELSGCIDQLTGTVNEVEQHVQLANSNMQQAQVHSTNGVNEVGSSIAQIKTMAENIERCVRTIDELNQKSLQITSILDVIAGISDQTNLLALNAAIEAARAGDAGRGFSVVADEVRTLALKTNDATKSIRKMIDELNTGTSNAVHTMQQTHEQSARIVNTTHSLGQALEEISSTIQQMATINKQISSSVDHHAQVASQVVNGVHQVASVADALMERSRHDLKSALELDFLSRSAAQLAGRFKLPSALVKHINMDESALDKQSEVIATWHEGFLLQIPSMDNQHKRIFDAINALYKAYINNTPGAQIMAIIQDLGSIALKHLSDEEAAMKQAHYADFATHLESHDALRQEFHGHLKALKTELSDENLIKFIMFLRNWIIDHIFATDRLYAKTLINAGIK